MERSETGETDSLPAVTALEARCLHEGLADPAVQLPAVARTPD